MKKLTKKDLKKVLWNFLTENTRLLQYEAFETQKMFLERIVNAKMLFIDSPILKAKFKRDVVDGKLFSLTLLHSLNRSLSEILKLSFNIRKSFNNIGLSENFCVEMYVAFLINRGIPEDVYKGKILEDALLEMYQKILSLDFRSNAEIEKDVENLNNIIKSI